MVIVALAELRVCASGHGMIVMKNARVDLSGESRFFLWRSGLRTTRNRGMVAATSRAPLRLSLRAGFLKEREKGRTRSLVSLQRFKKPALQFPR